MYPGPARSSLSSTSILFIYLLIYVSIHLFIIYLLVYLFTHFLFLFIFVFYSREGGFHLLYLYSTNCVIPHRYTFFHPSSLFPALPFQFPVGIPRRLGAGIRHFFPRTGLYTTCGLGVFLRRGDSPRVCGVRCERRFRG